MAELIIKIPDNKLIALKKCAEFGMELDTINTAVVNGILIPKGHGRIGDLDELQKMLDEYVLNDKSCPMHIASEIYYNIDTFESIIGADKE